MNQPSDHGQDGREMEQAEVRRALEAILFLADEPIGASTLAQILERGRREIEDTLVQMQGRYEERLSGIVLRNVGGGWRLMTHPEAAPYVQQFVLSSRHTRLTRASLETLAVVAYKQPVTRHQVSSIRGVDSDGVLRALDARYRNLRVFDWAGLARSHPWWFGPDGVHPTTAGYKARAVGMARLIRQC